MELDFAVLLQYRDILIKGFLLTIGVCVVSLALALVGGAVLALARLSRLPLLTWLALVYIEVFRNIPFMIQVFLFYYVLPFFGFRPPAYVVGIIALSSFASAYYAEIIRGAILSVPSGQMESARATGMSYTQAMRHVIFPQMMGYLIPPATNQSTSLVKESSILSTITVHELTMAAQVVQAETYSHIEVLVAIALTYWAVNASLSHVARRLEVIVQPYRRRIAKRAALAHAPVPVAGGP